MEMKLNQAGPHLGSGTLVFHDSSWNCTDGPIEVLRDIDTATVTVSDTSDQHVILGLRSEQEDSIFMAHLGIVASRRWVCSAKNKLWWMTPSWGSDISYLPIETQFLLFELEQSGYYGMILPLICDNLFTCTLRGGANSGCVYLL
ncbi:Putative galactinol--sucrose galactosyltransferase 2 [Picochlorum sp. SENEW3]|nr:Putative galactinol--sucrose galactosyltransferase 2 [Picochlorum sp. SENEW3]